MSVAAASGAVSTQQQHRPTQEQIRLAQLIEDKKHDHPEVKEILRKVLDVVVNSKEEDALVALFDCDYDYEKTVALLIEKGHEVASEWRTATNHKLTKKQQQKVAATKNGHRELDENGQQRGNDGLSSRGKSRGGRTRIPQNEGDSQHGINQKQQENDNPISQQRQRGGSAYRGRYRGSNRGGHRGINRNHQHVQDSNNDILSPSDTNRRTRGGGAAAVASNHQQQQYPWEVDHWDGRTMIISRTAVDDEQPLNSNESSEVPSSQPNRNNQEKSKPDFDPIEAARQIKNVIGIGQAPKPVESDQLQKSKTIAPLMNTKLTPPPRIPQQPVVFSDHFDGGVNKIDVQFGNIGESSEDTSSASAFYQQSQSISSNKISQRTTEQSSHSSPSSRPSEQPVMNQQQQQQRVLQTQIQQQPTMPMKQVVTPQYTLHQQQHPITAPNILLQSLLYQQHQPDPITLDTTYDPTAFSLPSIDFNSQYFMAAQMSQQQSAQQQTQPRYLVSQQPSLPQQASSKNAQTSSVSTTTSATTANKAPAIPPGMFPTAPQLNPATYSTAYNVQQQTAGATYSTPYDTEHLFANTYMPLNNTQQAQSPSGAYGSVTPPVQQQTNNKNDNKTLNYPPPITDGLMLVKQYHQYTLQQSNSQQQGQQTATHSPAPLSYFLSHAPNGPGYSAGPPIMYAQAPTAMPQHQQAPKQQGQPYNQNNSSPGMGGNDSYYSRNSSSSNKEGQYMYTTTNQPQHVQTQSAGQQQNINKQQHQQRTTGNAYNNQQGQQRPYQ
ncbi:unnamed protein product [Rotaria magnacalcarata]|uniref:Uncharacterized protein n=1 Tax=Rotaria magnacalcarata TaxID=392030 RepID=A0A816ZXN4_9BILA|nr:unnamed protein product [Rotaria magnacalcarata]